MEFLDKADIMCSHYDPYNVYRQSYVHFLIQESGDFIDTIAQFPDDFNKQDGYGLTPIHYAVEYRLYDLLRFLLDHGGDPRIADMYGATPLMLAQRFQFYECVLLLQRNLKKKRILFKMKCIVKWLAMYRKSVESVWKPGGVGYLEAKKHFESLNSNEHRRIGGNFVS